MNYISNTDWVEGLQGHGQCSSSTFVEAKIAVKPIVGNTRGATVVPGAERKWAVVGLYLLSKFMVNARKQNV